MSKENSGQLSDEFNKEIKESRKNNNILGTIIAIIAIFLVFGTIGIAGYQMLFRPESIDSKSASEKIESRPTEKKETTPAVTTETPKTEPVTTPATTTTPATDTAAKDTSYTVKSGDTWSSIANANGMSSTKLMEYNGTTDENLQIGQVIKIPKS